MRLLLRPTLMLACAVPTALAQLPGTVAGDRARLAEITGDTSSAFRGTLAAWNVSPRRSRSTDSIIVALLQPDMRVAHNSTIPFTLDDGPMWAGRGWSVAATAGVSVTAHLRRATVVTLVLAPTVLYSQNLPFQVFAGTNPQRSPYASPFHDATSSMDLPMRFGDLYLVRLDPGRSTLAVASANVQLGLTTANEVWGPAIRSPLVMSANAPGIPRFFIGTRKPWRSRAGALDARLVAGTLTESRFFDRDPANDFRSLSGFVVTFTPAFDSTLTFGLERTVYSPVERSIAAVAGNALDAAFEWRAMPDSSDSPAGSDQITGLFARWTFPTAGLEVYGEFARMDLPRTVSGLLVAAHHSGAVTLGLQWAPHWRRGLLRFQGEVSSVEQSRVYPERPFPDFYSGMASPQGYTQRGQVIGAPTGPGSSSQFLALDYMPARWQGGVFAGRIRWDNDALYRQIAPNFFRHDVTVFAGLRGGYRTRFTDLSADVTFGYRYNYLFQFGGSNPGGFRTVDVRNATVRFSATPR